MSLSTQSFYNLLIMAEVLDNPQNKQKTPISILNEIGSLCGFRVDFKIIECSLSSVKSFSCTLRFDNICTQGLGSNKKDAKQRAAEKALEKITQMLKKEFPDKTVTLPPIHGVITGSTDIQPGSNNPIGDLQELAGQQHIGNPTYSLISEEGQSHEKQFTIEVQYSDFKCTGAGRNKKVAKRVAAENMLKLLKKEGPVSKYGHTNRSIPSTIKRTSASSLLPSDNVTNNDTWMRRTDAAITPRHWLLQTTSPYKEEDFIIPLQKWKETEKLCSKKIDLKAIQRLQERVNKLGLEMKFHEINEKSKSNKVQCFVEVFSDPLCVQVGHGQDCNEAQADAANNAIQFLDTVIEAAKITSKGI